MSQGFRAAVDDADYDRVSQYKWSAIQRGRYAVRSETVAVGKRRIIYLHRFIMDAPEGLTVDHINGNGLDNRRCNLRICSQGDNVRNRRHASGGTSKYQGVCWNKARRKWQANITVDNRLCYLGLFDDEQDAARAYNAAAVEHFGEFARLNDVA